MSAKAPGQLFSRRGPTRLTNERKRTSIYFFSIIAGIAAGLVTVGYRSTISWIEHRRALALPALSGSWVRIVLWVGLAAAGGVATALMTKKSPLIRGSGIPQVKAWLLHRLHFDWKLELPFKFLGGSLALGAGMSLGREGPSIQLGALAGSAIATIPQAKEYARYLVTAGAAAGISAAFNAPLAAVLFVVEELQRSVSPVMLTSSMVASFVSYAVVWVLSGNESVFDIQLAQVLPLNMYFSAVLLMGLATGALGSLFNRALTGSQALYRRLVPDTTARIISAFVVAALVSLVFMPVTGGGQELVSSLLHIDRTLPAIATLLVLKLLFTAFSYASGSPGGIFLPMLAIGALIGALMSSAMGEAAMSGLYLPNFVLIGMVGFFAAVVRAPITGAVLITEMAGSFAHFPAFIFVSFVASMVAAILNTRPIYDYLLEQFAGGPSHT